MELLLLIKSIYQTRSKINMKVLRKLSNILKRIKLISRLFEPRLKITKEIAMILVLTTMKPSMLRTRAKLPNIMIQKKLQRKPVNLPTLSVLIATNNTAMLITLDSTFSITIDRLRAKSVEIFSALVTKLVTTRFAVYCFVLE